MRVLLAGVMARHPYGGVAWCSLMYLLGLRDLGHEVFYVEDTGEGVYDVDANTLSTDPSYGLRHIDATLRPHGLGDRWSFVSHDGTWHGAPRARVQAFCRDADLFVNLSGGAWFWRDEYAGVPRKVFVDSDPAFTQTAIAAGPAWYVDFFRRFDRLFTFGQNIGTPASSVPAGEFRWHKTWQPVVGGAWRSDSRPRDRRFTTVMTWRIESFAEVGGHKDQEFLRIIDLPARVGDRFRLALNGPHDLLREHGWHTVDGVAASRDTASYRAFVQASYAEFSVAKQTYVKTCSGWFSDRTECYLAAGRPALVQDTGWTAHLPHGDGLLAFSTLDEAEDGVRRIDADYGRHADAARAIAGAHFDAAVVLPRFLEVACS
jgi:hypothetical protein